jgi:hypothetical protein
MVYNLAARVDFLDRRYDYGNHQRFKGRNERTAAYRRIQIDKLGKSISIFFNRRAILVCLFLLYNLSEQ